MIKYEKLLIALLLFSSITFGQSVLTIGKVVASGANPVLIPVSISSAPLSNVKSISMQINYDPTKVSLNRDLRVPKKGYTNFLLPNESNFSITANNGVISISWINSTGTGVTLNNKMFDLELNYISGFSELKISYATIKNMSGAKFNYTLEHGWIAQNTDPAVVVQYPNGGETLEVIGTASTIKWTAVNITNIDLDYTTDNGTSWLPIASNLLASSGSYLWTIPTGTNSSSCKIRATESGASATDQSDAVFTINSTPVITVLSPNGSEELKVGGVKRISWTTKNVSNLKLQYCTNSTDPTPTWYDIVPSISATKLFYDWTIPSGINSVNCKIKISDLANLSTVSDQSDAVFSITSTPVAITIPKKVEAVLQRVGKVVSPFYWLCKSPTYGWDSGSEYYDNDDGHGHHTTFHYRDTLIVDGAVPVTVGWLTNVTYLEMFINYNPSILIFDSLKTSIADLSSINASAENGVIHIIWSDSKPLDLHGRVFDLVFTYRKLNNPLQWFPSGWDIFSHPTLLDPSIPNATLDPRNYSEIKIESVTAINNKNFTIDASAWSNGSLAVSNSPAVKLLSPIGGKKEVLETNDVTKNITWSSKLIDNLSISYSTDDGSSWTTITGSTAASAGTYSWTLPTDVYSARCRIKLSGGGAEDISDSTFTITNVKSIDLTSPDAGDILKVGSTKIITWKCRNLTYVKLVYSVDNGTTWTDIAASDTAKKYSYKWVVPNTPSNTCLVRISDASNATLLDVSSGVFEINNSKVLVSIHPTGTPSPPATFTVPVNVDKVNSVTYISLSIQFNPTNLVFKDVVSSSALNAGNLGYSLDKTDNRTIRIVWISATPIDVSGNLFSINFTPNNSAGSVFTFGTLNQLKDQDGKLIPITLMNSDGTDIKLLSIPKSFALHQNYPNPFNPTTVIRYDLPKNSNVNITVYNILGQKITTLIDEPKITGSYEVNWNASGLSNGVYFYCIRTEDFSQTKKMILLK